MERRLSVLTDAVASSLDERRVPEPPPSTRSESRRDRDRILYSSAFLRLGNVTQVAAPEVGHTFHSRLTHSLKVAQVSAGLVERLKALAVRGELDDRSSRLVGYLDEHAAEAAALAHDLGHPPFGHLAEQVLQTRSQGVASFEGNPQSFRIVTRLSLRSADSPGLNLTRRTLNGMLKYPWARAEEPPSRARKWGAYDPDMDTFTWARRGLPEDERTLEAEVMDWADDVTYAVHDMDDFYRAGLVPLDRLVTDSAERQHLSEHLCNKYGNETGGRLSTAAERLFTEGFVSSIRVPFSGMADERANLRSVSSTLIGRYIDALNLRDSADENTVTLEISDEVFDEVAVLKECTWLYIIDRPSLAVIQHGQEHVIDALYTLYHQAVHNGDTKLLPPAFAQRIPGSEGAALERIVIDLIAGMTEASAAEIYKQQLGIVPGSLLSHIAVLT